MDWKTLLTAFAGALGGTATALATMGFFGKTLLEHWFKKDFKRYEAKLDALASKDETRFNILQNERAVVAKEIFSLSREIGWISDQQLAIRLLPENVPEQTNEDRLTVANNLMQEVSKLTVYLEKHSIYLDAETITSIRELISYTYKVIGDEKNLPSIKAFCPDSDVNTKIAAVEHSLKKLLGSDKY